MRAFALETAAAAGEEGVLVSTLGGAIHKRFPQFRVRELGFRTIRLYLESVPELAIRKADGEFRAFAQ